MHKGLQRSADILCVLRQLKTPCGRAALRRGRVEMADDIKFPADSDATVRVHPVSGAGLQSPCAAFLLPQFRFALTASQSLRVTLRSSGNRHLFLCKAFRHDLGCGRGRPPQSPPRLAAGNDCPKGCTTVAQISQISGAFQPPEKREFYPPSATFRCPFAPDPCPFTTPKTPPSNPSPQV